MRIILIICLFCASGLFAQHYNCKLRHMFQIVPLVDAMCCGRDKVYVTGDPTPCNYDGWQLYFEDNFDESSDTYGIDPTKWRYPYQEVLAGFDFDNGTKVWYANTGDAGSIPYSNNVKVENGYLKLIAKKENPPINGYYVTNWSPYTVGSSSFDYSSGWIESKKNFGYGYYEIRCQLPKGKGMWPAFWLFSGQYGAAIEIDIFEFWNESCITGYDPSKLSENAHMNLHSDRKNPGVDRTCPSELYGSCTAYPGSYLSVGFHTYGLEWDYYKVVWYIDGNEVRRDYRFVNLNGQNLDCNSFTNPMLYAQYWPSADNMNVRFNLGVQNGSDSPDANTVFPKEFVIDYFRYYKQASCVTNNVITTNPQLDLSSELYNTRMGQNVTISGTATVNSNQQLEVIGSNSVVLDPGFEAANGSEFIAHIDQGYCSSSSIAANNQPQERIPNINNEIANQENVSLGSDELSETDVLKVYPNPTSDHLMIELTSGSGLNQIDITDNQGRSLLSDSRELKEAMNLDVSTFSPGTYFIKIVNKQSGKVYLERFTKNK